MAFPIPYKSLLLAACLSASLAATPILIDPRKTPRRAVSREPAADLKVKIRDAAVRAALDPSLVEAVVRVESNFHPNATSNKGARGLMQVIPKTATELQIDDAYHPASNLMGACEYLRKLLNRYQGNVRFALAAYNAGPSNVDRYGGIPPFAETREYVRKVMDIYQSLKRKSLLTQSGG